MTLSIALLTDELIPSVANLVQTQQRRHFKLDPRLRPMQNWETVRERLRGQVGSGLVVLSDEDGNVRGYGCPDVWHLPQESTLSAFLTEHNGIAKDLTLPDQEEDASSVTTLLLSHLLRHWQKEGTTGALIRWPSADVASIQELLFAHHQLQLDSECALAPRHTPLSQRRHCPAVLTIRPALRHDEDILLGLFREELEYHAILTSFVRTDERALTAFQKKLGKLWEGGRLGEGAPMILVAEMERRIVGMVQFDLLQVGGNQEPGYTPAGCYGCIDNLSVQASFQGQGIGRLLAQAAFDQFAHKRLEGFVLWYNPDNTRASSFWQRLGFAPLWTTYQRISQSERSKEKWISLV